jgi:hypothetical protein
MAPSAIEWTRAQEIERVPARAAELIAEEMTLRELRHARKLTAGQGASKRPMWPE